MEARYLTVKEASQAVFKEKMSKFIAFAYPIYRVDQAKEHIARIQKDYHDARHVCWAYMLGADRLEFQWTDNGEPSGTAGKPILGQINSFGLTNVVIVVVRYFGGIKLGTSGLIEAYREAAKEALSAAEIVEDFEKETIAFSFPYISMNNVMRLCKDNDTQILAQSFDNCCEMQVSIRKDKASQLKKRLRDIDGLCLLQGE